MTRVPIPLPLPSIGVHLPTSIQGWEGYLHPAFLIVVVLAGPATAVAVASAAYRLRVRRRPGVMLAVRPPAGGRLDLEAWERFFQTLYGIVRPNWKVYVPGQPRVAFELVKEKGRVGVRCWCPAELKYLLISLLHATLPGIDIEVGSADLSLGTTPASRARLGFWRDDLYPLGTPRADTVQPIADVLCSVPKGRVQLVISPDEGWQRRALRALDDEGGSRRPPVLVRLLSFLVSFIVGIVFDLIWSGPAPEGERERRRLAIERPSAAKAGGLGFRAELRLRVEGPTLGLARRYMQALASSFRVLDGANGLRSRRVWRRRHFDRALVHRYPPRRGGPILSPGELASLFHLPIASPAMEGPLLALPPAAKETENAKVICLADDDERTPITISPADARHHMHVHGPIGSGKSTLLLNLALDDIEAKRAVIAFDNKGDLARDLLERIPISAWDRVRIADPTLTLWPVGLNVLDCPNPEMRELVADQGVGILHRAFDRWWGPRTDDVLRAAYLTLLHEPGATVCEVPLLLLYPERYRHLIDALDDPVGLDPFWDEYLSLTERQRSTLVGPVLSRLRSVLLRRGLRNVLGQPTTIDMAEVLDKGGILIVSAPKGMLGEEASRLFLGFLFAQVWNAALARTDRPESWRPDATLLLDEFPQYLQLPQGLAEAMVDARGLHLGMVLANQFFGQLTPGIRAALDQNARTRVVFQAGQEDARYLAREFEPRLTEADLRHLRRYQCAVRLFRDGRTHEPVTGTTRPAPASLGHEHYTELVNLATHRYGRPRADVEREIVDRLHSVGLTEEGFGDDALI